MSENQPDHGRIDFEDELRRYARAEPFQPFDIVTASGAEYRVTDSLQLAFGQNALVFVSPKSGIQMIRKAHIAAVHVHEPA
jgi:hypothetical protein